MIQLGLQLRASDVPDALMPTDNVLDIPVLDITHQAEFLTLPFEKWGDAARSSHMPGTYHFYTDDYKFEGLWRNPTKLINSRCHNAIEPNFSTNDAMPMAVGIYQVYRKRWLARYWQSYGVRIFVDLSVSNKFVDINLSGVPRGWRAYATRALSKDVDFVLQDYAIAQDHAELDEPLFIVYGGGKAIHELCKQHELLWIPENMSVKDGKQWAVEVVEAVGAGVEQEAARESTGNLRFDPNKGAVL